MCYTLGMARPYKVLGSATDSDWLAKRASLVTASEAHSLFVEARPEGKKWPLTRSELVQAKCGPQEPLRDTRYMAHGRFDEDTNRRKFSACTGLRTRATHLLLESTLVPGLGCTLDGLVIGLQDGKERPGNPVYAANPAWIAKVRDRAREVGLLEMKQTEAFFGKEWAAGVPEHYLTQLRVQLVVTGKPYGVICCQIGAADMVAHVVEHPGQPYVDLLREEVASFRSEVEYERA